MTRYDPSVEIIIPHYKGRFILERCLDSLVKTSYPAMSICIVDNGSGEGDICAGLERRIENLRVVTLPLNEGYAGGCNSALFSSSADYVVFMNDDAVVEPSWLLPLVEQAESDGRIAALQPKILSLQAKQAGKKIFDYAGAAGGLIDRLGYPYCYGRTFFRTENDHGQYDEGKDIFWASGVAMFAKRAVVADLGGFDDDFFMHMEEIDLCWRILLQGYRIVSAPSSIVYHEGGASLAKGTPKKIYLNHRNNLAMLLKNRSATALVWVLPLRMILECVAAVRYLATGSQRVNSTLSVLRSLIDNIRLLRNTLRKRNVIQGKRTVTDKMLFRNVPLSIVFGLAARDEG
ncbi:glycosyltransferase family 2 protein [Prosthecochloris sp.]|uniref:glycosyltransferase family 2 protein n=1 Tax=Prosthecochloris sp. TaxID=290513 RepID=UPI0025FFBF01|nr:glycosyltransferase family 2 protein [Prosthecochloris sp.]